MAITTTYLTGFEHGFSGTSSNMALGAGLIAGASGSGITVTAGAARNGGYGLHCNAPLNTPTWISATISGTKLLARFAVKISTLPSSGTTVVAAAHASGRWLYLYVDSNGQLSCQINAGSIVTGATINTTNWHLIELQADVTGTPATVAWKVDGVTQSAVSTSSIADTWATFYLGSTNSSQQASVADYDDFIVGNWTTTTDWYGEGQVLGQLAGSDGTHATVADFSPGDSTAAFSGTVTTAYTYLDSPPATSGWTNSRSTTDNLGMRTANTSAYLEIKPVTTAHTGSANAVRALLSYSSSTTSANLAACDVRNSAGTVNALRGTTGGTGATYNFTGNNYAGVLVSTPVAGWTATEVNAIKLRFGGCTSSDISPVPTIQEWMLEVDWPVTVTNAPVTAVTAAATSAAPTPVVGVSEEVVAVTAAGTATASVPTTSIVTTEYPDLISSETGLVSYWRLGEASGNALDSKDSNPGTTVAGGITRNVAGLLYQNADGAVSGDGVVGTYINVPYSANMVPGSTLTYECWVNITTYVANPQIIGRNNATTFLSETSNTGFRWYVRDVNSVDTIIDTSNTIAVGTVQHVVGTYDAAGTMKLYVNGVSVGAQSRTPNANASNGSGAALQMLASGVGTASMLGVLDEVALYNVALTPAQVAAHYTAGSNNVLLRPSSAGASAAAPVPAVVAQTSITITAVTASATAGAPVPTSVTATISTTITAVPAIGLAVGPLPTLVNARAPPSAAGTSTAPVPTVVAVQNITLSAVAAGASAAAPVSTVSAIQNRTVAAVPASATSAAPAPTVAVSANITITAVAASASSTASLPTVVAVRNVTLTAVAASATPAAPVPTVVATRNATVTAVPASATSTASVPTVAVFGNVTITAVSASGVGEAPVPGVGATYPISTLVDDFGSGVLGPAWEVYAGDASVADGHLELVISSDGNSWSQVRAPGPYTIGPGDSLAVEVYGDFPRAMGVGLDSMPGGAYASFSSWDAANLAFAANDGDGATAVTASITYDPVAHRWLRIRLDGTTMLLETSPDGATWTTQLDHPDWMAWNSDVVVYRAWLENDSFDPVYPTVYFDNVNVKPVTLVAVSASGSAAAPAPTITSTRNVTLTAVAAGASATAPAPGLLATRNISLSAVSAGASASAPTPTVVAGTTVTAPPASASASAPTPQVALSATISAPSASGVAGAPTPGLQLDASVDVPSAEVDASGVIPEIGITLAAPAASALASAPRYRVSGQQDVDLSAPSASARATAPRPKIAVVFRLRAYLSDHNVQAVSLTDSQPYHVYVATSRSSR